MFSYPLLGEITKYYSLQKRNSFEDFYVFGCQHILEPQQRMIEAINKFGVPKENIFILGKIYSTNFEVLKELQRNNFHVVQPEFHSESTFDDQHRENCSKYLEEFVSNIKPEAKIIILDDGGEILKIANEKFIKIREKGEVLGIEQTSSGFRKLEKQILNFPVINVARSSIKLNKESPIIAELGCRRIIDLFGNHSIKNPRILVVGLGPIGKNVFGILKQKEHFVIGHNVEFDSQSEILDLILKNNINVIVGATGANIITEIQLEELNGKTTGKIYLVSMSSSDREFPAAFIRTKGASDESVHGDSIWNNIVLINNGFPITFRGYRYESTPEEIEKTIALLYGSVLASLFHLKSPNGFIDVPDSVINIVEKYE